MTLNLGNALKAKVFATRVDYEALSIATARGWNGVPGVLNVIRVRFTDIKPCR